MSPVGQTWGNPVGCLRFEVIRETAPDHYLVRITGQSGHTDETWTTGQIDAVGSRNG